MILFFFWLYSFWELSLTDLLGFWLFFLHIFCILFFLLSPDASTPHYIHLPLHYPWKPKILFFTFLISNYCYFLLYIHLFFIFPSPFFSPSVFYLSLPLYAFIFLCVFLCNTPTTLTITCSLPSFLWTSFHLLPLFLLKITLRWCWYWYWMSNVKRICYGFTWFIFLPLFHLPPPPFPSIHTPTYTHIHFFCFGSLWTQQVFLFFLYLLNIMIPRFPNKNDINY